jgi:hypothetical protein
MAKRFESLNRLFDTVRESSHDFRMTTAPFNELDPEKLERTLELVEKGRSNGSANLPAAASQEPDDVEKTIIELVNNERDDAFQVLDGRLEDYATRIRNFNFDGHFSQVRLENKSSAENFRAHVASGSDELHTARELLRDADVELANFRKENGLEKRVAKLKTTGFTILKWLVIVVLLVVETWVNGIFLAEATEGGRVEALTLAFAFAFANVAVTVICGLFLIPNIIHKSYARKLIGFLSILFWTAFVCALNFVMAHFREVAMMGADNLGTAVMEHIAKSTFTFSNIESWILFVSGLVFSIIALVDTLLMKDPYPHYAATYKQYLDKKYSYIDQKRDLIEDLKETRDVHNARIEEIIRALSNRRKDSAAAIDARSRMIKLFTEHQVHLEEAARRLLGTYWDANRKARTEPEPRRFSTKFKLERRKSEVDKSSDWSDKELTERINAAQAELMEQMTRISKEFDDAVAEYRQLDNIFPETINGAP